LTQHLFFLFIDHFGEDLKREVRSFKNEFVNKLKDNDHYFRCLTNADQGKNRFIVPSAF